jgi:hypothetical protein
LAHFREFCPLRVSRLALDEIQRNLFSAPPIALVG